MCSPTTPNDRHAAAQVDPVDLAYEVERLPRGPGLASDSQE
jgi:hypothetical protein